MDSTPSGLLAECNIDNESITHNMVPTAPMIPVNFTSDSSLDFTVPSVSDDWQQGCIQPSPPPLPSTAITSAVARKDTSSKRPRHSPPHSTSTPSLAGDSAEPTSGMSTIIVQHDCLPPFSHHHDYIYLRLISFYPLLFDQ